MEGYKKRNIILWCLAGGMAATTLIVLIRAGVEGRVILAAAICLVCQLIIQFLQYQNMRVYMRELLIKLSDLLAVITELRTEEVFPELEDTLLSKLQNQVVKLSGILKAQNDRMRKERNEIKALVSDISHQLKTPIAAVNMYGEFIRDEQTTEAERKEYVEIMEQAIHKLSFLADSMIRVSRLESGVIQLKKETAPINETVLGAVMQVHQKARNKDIHIDLEETCGQLLLKHDKRWTEEAIFNILDNAVKYTGSNGSIKIIIEEYETYCRIDIADNGKGIPEAEQPLIFQRFYRGHQAVHEEGVGIGLYLSRRIILEQEGYIKVSSGEQGTVFSVFLRLED